MGIFNFLVGLVTPTSISTRAYMVQQLAHYGVPKGRLSKECVDALTDQAVAMAKRLAPGTWLELAVENIEATAINVSRYLEGERPALGITNPAYEILVRHGAFQQREARSRPVASTELRTLREEFEKTIRKVEKLNQRERVGFTLTIFVATSAYIEKFGGHEGFGNLPPDVQRKELKETRRIEQLAMEKAAIDPIALGASLARHAHAYVLAAIILDEPECVNAATAALAPFIEEGEKFASTYRPYE